MLRPFAILEQPDSFYVSGVALFPEFRDRGIGRRLMELAFAQARTRALPQVSLIVFEQNVGAKRLYDRLGFREVMREPIVPHAMIHHGGDALLMVKTL